MMLGYEASRDLEEETFNGVRPLTHVQRLRVSLALS